MSYFKIDNFIPYNKLLNKLSEREIQLLLMSCSGLSRKEIALELNISIHSVNSHFSNAEKKYEKNTLNELQSLFNFVTIRYLANIIGLVINKYDGKNNNCNVNVIYE